MDRLPPASPADCPGGARAARDPREPDARDAMPRRSARSCTTRCSSLPAFLAHYRRLGVDRFIVLDDCSTDGTMAFLAAQPDVMVVESGIRYFAEVPYPPETLARIRETRAVRLWRDQMLDQFCTGQWAVVVDPDEFLALPADLPAFFASLAAEGAEAAWGVMVDMYPERVRDILGSGLPRASASRTPGSSTRSRISTRASRARPRRCRAPSIRAAWRGSSPPGGSCRRARSCGGSAAGSRATATRAPARSTRPRSSSGARATGS